MIPLAGHEGPVNALAFSPDGRLLASAGRDGTLRLWQLGSEPTVLRQHTGAVTALAFRPDGRLLAIGGADGAIYLIYLTDAPVEHYSDRVDEMTPGANAVTGLAYLSDDRTLAAAYGERLRGDRPGGVLLWDVIDRRVRQSPGQRTMGQYAAAGAWALAGTGGRAFAWSTGDKRLFYWDITASTAREFPSRFKKGGLSLAFAPDGQTLAAADDWTVKLFDVSGRRERATLKGHKGQVSAVAIGPDGRTLASGGADGAVKFWDLTGEGPALGQETASYQWPLDRVTCVAFAPDGLTAAAAGSNGTVLLWDVG